MGGEGVRQETEEGNTKGLENGRERGNRKRNGRVRISVRVGRERKKWEMRGRGVEML